MGDRPESGDQSAAVLLRLPDAHRSAFKDPIGPVYPDVVSLLAEVSEPIIAVGDIVSASFLEADRIPAVAIVDGRSQREPIDASIRDTLEPMGRTVDAVNPAGTITRSMIDAIRRAIDADGPMKVVVDGEEDLAVLPAVLAAPSGATVVYGQPDEGLVAILVDPEARRHVRDLLAYLEGDHEAVDRLLAG